MSQSLGHLMRVYMNAVDSRALLENSSFTADEETLFNNVVKILNLAGRLIRDQSTLSADLTSMYERIKDTVEIIKRDTKQTLKGGNTSSLLTDITDILFLARKIFQLKRVFDSGNIYFSQDEITRELREIESVARKIYESLYSITNT